MIYFLKHPAGPIKIGTTIRLSQRLKQLVAEHGGGLEVLAVVDGSFEVERDLHGRFAHLRTVGEWFEPGDDLLGFIVSDGRPWNGEDEASPVRIVRVDVRALSLCRRAAAATGEALVDYISRVLLEQAERDVRADAERTLAEMKSDSKAKKP